MTFEFNVKDQNLIPAYKKKIRKLSRFCKSSKITTQEDLNLIVSYVQKEFDRKCLFSILYPHGYNSTDTIPKNATIKTIIMPAIKSFDTGNTVPTIL